MSEAQDVVQSTETPAGVASVVSGPEWTAMSTVLNNIYAYRTEDGADPSKMFHRKVNKRSHPDYYEVVKEPIALSTIKAKINNKEYRDFKEFVRDFALIPHNAQVYNRPESVAYVDALILKDVLLKELQKAVDDGVVTAETIALPYLGEIPEPEDIPQLEDAEGEEEEADEEDEDEEEQEDSDGDGRRKKKRGGRRSSGILKRENSSKFGKIKDDDDDEEDVETRKRRGRPPRVDTPMEARIKNVMKAMRRPKNSLGQYKISHFDRLPDKAEYPEYYAEIKNPMAMDVVKKKIKRKKYTNIDQFMKDVELMFDNAKSYNADESQIYIDAVELQEETRSFAADEKKRPDSDFAQEDGRIPLPDGILSNGELWKVGDWVHIINANDLTKPIVAQIYRTWQDTDGNKWVNACWYYRPEQTVHRFDRHFFENEVVKTGQYRDHPIDEVIDRCFVMFITRYHKGRPRNFPTDKEVYVCESRYNEEKHKLNKIKTWASCLPDEVRDKDYEMDMFKEPRKSKKKPSPIEYLFKEGEQKETDEMPKAVWGAPNAPPKIGAVHCHPRDPKDSPPPGPTPSPPPVPPPAAIAPPSLPHAPSYSQPRPPTVQASHSPMPPSASPAQSRPTTSYNQTQPVSQYYQQSASPAPATHQHQYSHSQSRTVPTPNFQPPPLTPSASYTQGRPAPTPLQQYAGARSGTPSQHYPQQQTSSFNQPHYQHTTSGNNLAPAPLTAATSYSRQQNPAYPTPTASSTTGYNAPNAIEVYRLPDNADDMIAPDIRSQFHTDINGRVLFFTVPPAQSDGPLSSVKNQGRLQHSAKYLAWKIKREEQPEQARSQQHKREAEASMMNGSDEKRLKINGEGGQESQVRAEILADGLADEYRAVFGDGWVDALRTSLQNEGTVTGMNGSRASIPEDYGMSRAETIPVRGVNAMLEFSTS